MGRRAFMLGSLLTTLGTGAVVGGGPAQAEDTSSDALVLTDDSARYPDFVRGNNQRWVGRPETVVLPQSTPQVVKAVQQAVSNGKRISVRSGGHCYEDFVYNAETQVVIDLSGMESVASTRSETPFT